MSVTTRPSFRDTVFSVFASLTMLCAVTTSQAQEDNGEFVSLFDGSTTAGWRGYGLEKAPEGWVVDDGSLHRKSGGGDLISEQQYRNFDLRFEWKVAEKGNSGVMYRVKETEQPSYYTGPEYQILDNQGHADGAVSLTSASSLYGLYAPIAEASKPANQWNRGRIVVKGNHVQHWLNDVLVVDCTIWSDDWNARLKRSKFAAWPDYAKMPRGHIVLQDHGDPVWYRSLRIKELPE